MEAPNTQPTPPEAPSSQAQCKRVYQLHMLFGVTLACSVTSQQVGQRRLSLTSYHCVVMDAHFLFLILFFCKT